MRKLRLRRLRVPAQLTIAPGTFFTVRVNQVLSSDRNHEGDAFSATLVKPIVVNGVIVADRGQTIQGRVSEAKKAGRVSGTSRLGLELTDMTLVDGSQVPVKTELVNRNGATSEGRDAVGIGAATGVGAIIGAGAAATDVVRAPPSALVRARPPESSACC